MLSAPTARGCRERRECVARQHRRQRQLGHCELPDLAIKLLAIEPRTRDAPVARRELEVAIMRPVMPSSAITGLELAPKYWRATRGRLRPDSLISAFEVSPPHRDSVELAAGPALIA